MKNFCSKIFSISEEITSQKTHVVLRLLFLKIKFEKIKRFGLKAIEGIKIIKNSKIAIKPYVAICAIYKNEPDLIDWIEYHKIVGVEKFYLYDNGSNDNSRELLEPYINAGTVVYHYVEGKCMQFPVYRDAISRYKNEARWIAFIDLDEYICPVEKDNLQEFLKDYEKYPAVGANWVMFDSNGHEKRPNLPVIEAYTRVFKNYQNPVNTHIKSIVNPLKVKEINNPHFMYYKNNELAVNENFEKIGTKKRDISKAFTKTNSIKKIRINHYHTKSLEDYNRKYKQGYADSLNSRPEADKVFNISEEMTKDYVIQKYLPELKNKLQSLEKVECQKY